MASKQQKSDVDPEELLDVVDKTLDRLKTLYEQYFLGIQKQAPTFIHNDIERKLRDLTQMQLRNTGLRYRLATLQQKFGSYNSYWRRTLRQIENGTYQRQLQKIGRDAARSGADIPDEILAAMPKRMRDQVIKDREVALAIAKRRQQESEGEDGLPPEADDAFIAMIKEPTEVRRKLKGTDGSHLLDGSDADFDIDAFFAQVEQEEPVVKTRTRPPTNLPRTRTKPTTTGDLIQSGTRRPTRENVPQRADTNADTGPVRATTEVGAAPAPPAHARPTQAMPKLPTGKGPPPIPGARASTQTDAIPPMPRPAHNTVDPEDERLTEKMGALPKPGQPQPLPRAPLPGMPRAPTAPGDRQTGAQPAMRSPTAPGDRQSGAQPVVPRPAIPSDRATGPQAAIPRPVDPTRTTGATPAVPRPVVPAPSRQTGPMTAVPAPVAKQTGSVPIVPQTGAIPTMASQASRPNPIAPGSAAAKGPVGVEQMKGPFPRPEPSARPDMKSTPIPAIPKPTGGIPAIPKPPVQNRTPAQGVPAIQKPPPGMSDADVNALYAKYVKAKEMVGEKIGPGEHSKLLKTINAQAPKIMEQYKAKGVDFSVVVKDNQVIIRAKPKP
ncbi:MAG: MXAN_5187 C-terminal domain-containing protein [Kofleriaceae bacterium]